jgi:hypothetical protein
MEPLQVLVVVLVVLILFLAQSLLLAVAVVVVVHQAVKPSMAVLVEVAGSLQLVARELQDKVIMVEILAQALRVEAVVEVQVLLVLLVVVVKVEQVVLDQHHQLLEHL